MKMKFNKKTRTAIVIACLLLFIPISYASVCTLMGYVTYPDGTIAKSGTGIRIVDIDLGTPYDVQTGGADWPYANFYLRSFTCNYGTDRIEVSFTQGNQTVRKQFVYDHFPYVANLTIPFAVEKIETEGEGTSSGGGGGGGSSGGSSGGSPAGGSSAGDNQNGGAPDFGFVIDQAAENRLQADDRFRLYIINDTRNIKMIIGDVEKIGKDSVRISFSTLKDDVVLRLNEPVTLDLDNDGKPDTRALVVDIRDNAAYSRFDRIFPEMNVPGKLNDSSNGSIESKVQHKDEPSFITEKDKDLALSVLGIILIVLMISIIYIDHREKGGINERRKSS